MKCPCGEAVEYDICCGLFHNGEKAKSAEKLMRSRYSAFVLGLGTYLYDTEVEDLHRDISLERFTQEIKGQHWVGLEVISSSAVEVEFKALLLEKEHLLTHHETSLFCDEDGRLKYAKAVKLESFKMSLKRNDVCPCGSGKKVKKCNHE